MGLRKWFEGGQKNSLCNDLTYRTGDATGMLCMRYPLPVPSLSTSTTSSLRFSRFYHPRSFPLEPNDHKDPKYEHQE